MTYEEELAGDGAKKLALEHWRFAADPEDPDLFAHFIPPDGLCSIAATMVGDRPVRTTLLGPSSRAFVVTVEKPAWHVGIRLRPGAAPRLGIDPAGLADALVELESLAPGLASRFEAAASLFAAASREAERAWTVFDEFLGAEPDARNAQDKLVVAFAESLLGGEWRPTGQAAREAGISERQLRRRFVHAIGLSPKAFAKARRQRAAWLAAIHDGLSLTEAAAAAGYADQAHFSRDVKFTYGAPAGQVRAYLARIGHRIADSRGG